MRAKQFQAQRGVMLIEAIIGMLIFLIGVLAMLALQGTAMSVQSDAQYRIEAAKLAERILAEINLGVDRSSDANLQLTLANFQHQPAGTNCNYSGAASANAAVTAWATAITTTATTRLPGATAASLQILLVPASFNQVVINICWQAANDRAPRRHTLTSYIN